MSSLSKTTSSKATDAELLRNLKSSISQFGILNPVTILLNQNRGFKIIDGHLRLQAAREIGITKVPAHDQYNRVWLLMYRYNRWYLEV